MRLRRAALGWTALVLAGCWRFCGFAAAPKLPKSSHRPKQELGQSPLEASWRCYLSDPNTIEKIFRSFRSGAASNAVVELGPGLGALTRLLAAEFPTMVAVEVDSRAVEALARDLPKLRVRHQDLLQLDHREMRQELGDRLSVVANLPYSITTEALLSLVRSPRAVRYALVMVQKEAAERIVAAEGSKDYGPLSVMLQLFTRPRQLYLVPATAFYPQPKVTSAMVELDFLAEEEMPEVDSAMLLEVVKECFRQRKRALRHSLKAYLQQRRLALPARWAKLRAERLKPGEFLELARQLQ
ncbi:unnamed protein product [Effrenium voratum]|uniref:rRNA adenine N(6)-methyltransferase n=1 Tax=Effrenium voratum TaxID=2562239 RepID=A0AA36HQT4_9DINO|nr:unnamed protein product [Effrenium voratum]